MDFPYIRDSYYKNIVNLAHTWERIETISYSGFVKWPYRIHRPLLNRFTWPISVH